MAKDYFCKDCDHNNNGWCERNKCQGLKDIKKCKDKTVTSEVENEDIDILSKAEVFGLINEIEERLESLRACLSK